MKDGSEQEQEQVDIPQPNQVDLVNGLGVEGNISKYQQLFIMNLE